jgi:Domain of unknown function (DUF4386)
VPTDSADAEPTREQRLLAGSETSAKRFPMPTHRVAPLAGILGWILVFVGLSIHGYPEEAASGQELVRWTAATDANRFAIGMYVELTGFLLELIFFAWLCEGLRRKKAMGWLVALGFGAILLWVGIILVDIAFWKAMLDAGKRGLEPQALAGLRDVAQETYYVTTLILGVGMLALGWVALLTHALPAWLGWAGLVIGLGMTIPDVTIGQDAETLFALWVIAAAAMFLVRSDAARWFHREA